MKLFIRRFNRIPNSDPREPTRALKTWEDTRSKETVTFSIAISKECLALLATTPVFANIIIPRGHPDCALASRLAQTSFLHLPAEYHEDVTFQ